jgi:hypothetical protein
MEKGRYQAGTQGPRLNFGYTILTMLLANFTCAFCMHGPLLGGPWMENARVKLDNNIVKMVLFKQRHG